MPMPRRTSVHRAGRRDVTATADGEDCDQTRVDGAPNDNGSPIDRYEIWMWDTTVPRQWGWNGVAGGLHTVQHPLATFTHGGLDAGTQNIYRVRAVNDAPDNNGVGKWSTIVSAKTDEAAE